MNLKKIENEWVSHYMNRMYISTSRYPLGESIMGKEVDKWIKRLLKKTIKQVVNSVPVEGETFESLQDYITGAGEGLRANGYNKHVQEIKQWKKKILKELR